MTPRAIFVLHACRPRHGRRAVQSMRFLNSPHHKSTRRKKKSLGRSREVVNLSSRSVEEAFGRVLDAIWPESAARLGCRGGGIMLHAPST